LTILDLGTAILVPATRFTQRAQKVAAKAA